MSETERPRVVVGVLAHNEDGEIFLIRSHKWGDRWVVPGGHIEFGERAEDAARREMKEETNLELTDVQFTGMMEGIFPPEFHERRHFIYLHFAARAKEGEVILNGEAQAHVWMKPDDALANLTLVPSVARLIEEYKVKNHGT